MYRSAIDQTIPPYLWMQSSMACCPPWATSWRMPRAIGSWTRSLTKGGGLKLNTQRNSSRMPNEQDTRDGKQEGSLAGLTDLVGRRQDHGIDHMDHAVRAIDICGRDLRAAVEGQ